MSEDRPRRKVYNANVVLAPGAIEPEKPKGVHSTRKPLDDGRVVIYDYAWKSGPRLFGKRNSPEYMADLKQKRVSGREVYSEDSRLSGLIQKYKESPDFADLAPATKINRTKCLENIKEEFGELPIIALADKRTRGKFKEWRDEIVKGTKPKPHPKRGPRKGSRGLADQHWEALSKVLNWSLDRGYIDVNPCSRGGSVYRGSRLEFIWTLDRERQFFYGDKEHGYQPPPLHIQRAYVLAVWTAQRESDLVDLRWSNYDGTFVCLEQHKRPGPGRSGKSVRIRVSAPLKAVLDQMEREAGVVGLSHEERSKRHVLLNARGTPWASAVSFSACFHRFAMLAGVGDRTFHDLRRTAVVRFAVAGSSIPQIAAITGHSVRDVRSILEKHYLYLDEALGDSAVNLREGSRKFPTDHLLPTVVPTGPQLAAIVRPVFKTGKERPSVNKEVPPRKKRRV